MVNKNKFKSLIVGLLILFAVSIVVSACNSASSINNSNDSKNADDTIGTATNPQDTIEQMIDLPKTCTDLGGNWLSDFDECEGIAKSDCDKIGGAFNECASACRHNPNAQICTLQCVQVCSFG